MSTSRILICGLVAALVCAARGADPASRPAATPLDLSSPKSAVLSAYVALRSGDVEAAGRCMSFANAAEAETFEMTVTPVWAPLRLQHSLETHFGDAARKLFSTSSLEKAADRAIDDLNRARIDINGDTAVVSDWKAAVDPMAETEVCGITLKQQGNQWRIVAATFPEMSGDIPAAQRPIMRSLKDAILTASQSTLARLDKGEFKTAGEAYAAYQSNVQQECVRTTATARMK